MKHFMSLILLLAVFSTWGTAQSFNKPYLGMDGKQLVYVSDLNGIEVRQPFHLSGIGLYDEVADTSVIQYNPDPELKYEKLKTAVANISEAKTRMIRLFCCHFSGNMPYPDHLHVPFHKNGGIFDVAVETFDLFSGQPFKYDAEWLGRLRAVIDKAKNPDGLDATQDAVIVQLSLFDNYDLSGNQTWPYSVWNSANNNANIIGPKFTGRGFPYFYLTHSGDAFSITGDYQDSWTVEEANELRAIQKNYVKQIVRYTANDWNVMYEIMNEPGKAGVANCVEASPEQVLDWHNDVRDWILEALREAGNGVIQTPHLIAVCSPNLDYKEVLYRDDNNFDIVSIHGGARGWNNERKNEIPYNWDPCGENPIPAVDYVVDLQTERRFIRGELPRGSNPFPKTKHIIVDTDGMWGLGGDAAWKGWARDYDDICWHIMNVAMIEGFSFNSKELMHNNLNENELDCNRNDNFPGGSTFHGMDKPYIDGVKTQISEVFMRPEVWLAGFGSTFLLPGDDNGEFCMYKRNPYGNGSIQGMSMSIDDGTETSEVSMVADPSSFDNDLGLYRLEFDPACVTNIFMPALKISGQGDIAYDNCWPELPILNSRNTQTLPSTGPFNGGNGNPDVKATIQDLLEANQGQPQTMLDVQAIDEMAAFRDFIITNATFDFSQLSNPIILAAGFAATKIIDIYGGNLGFYALVYHPQGTEVSEVQISLDEENWTSMSPDTVDGLYFLDISAPVDFDYMSLDDDFFIPVYIKAIDVNGNASDIWPELIVHDPNGDPSDNYRPTSKIPDITPPTFPENGFPHASAWNFYDDRLDISWDAAVNEMHLPDRNAMYDVSACEDGHPFEEIVVNHQGTELMVNNLDPCQKYWFRVFPKDTCGNIGNGFINCAYTGNPEVPFNLRAEKNNLTGVYTLRWDKRYAKQWEVYQIFKWQSAGGWTLFAEPDTCDYCIGETVFGAYKVRIVNDGVEGCFSDAVVIDDRDGLLNNKNAHLLDMNNDQLLDALVETGPTESIAYYQSSDGALEPAGFTVCAPASGIEIADLNRDMVLDLAYINDQTVNIMLNESGTLVPADNFDLSNGELKNVKSADLDNSGGKEVIVAKDNEITVATKEDDGGYQVKQTIPTDDNAIMALGDLNGDGYVDIVAANPAGEIKLLMNNGAGDISENSQIVVDPTITEIRLSDVDWDWDLDLIVVNSQGSQTFFNNGAGAF